MVKNRGGSFNTVEVKEHEKMAQNRHILRLIVDRSMSLQTESVNDDDDDDDSNRSLRPSKHISYVEGNKRVEFESKSKREEASKRKSVDAKFYDIEIIETDPTAT